MNEKLKDIAFRIHIEPFNTVENSARVDTVLKVLSDISTSYNNFLEIEFFKNEDLKQVYEKNKKVFDTIKEELSLLIVDLNFSSFEAALAPDILETQPQLFENEVQEWKRETFKDYKDSVLNGDYESDLYLRKIAVRYNDEERAKIFKPLFSSIGDGKEYKVNIKDNKQKTIRTLTQPENSKEFYVPKLPPAKLEPSEYSTVQVFAKIKKQGDKLIINQKNLKEVFYIEELDHELYPFKPDLIKYQDKNFVLNKKLDCKVSYEDENYIIHNEELDLTVWGESRKEVEEAFYFSFLSLYENYYNESDSNLSAAALILKGKLKDIINKVEDEA